MAVDDNAPSRSSTPPSHAMEKHSLEGQKHELPQEELDQDTTDDDANQNIPDYPTGLSLFLIIAGITVVMLLAMLDISIISTAIPQITSDFHRLEDVGWYVGAYQLASATVQPLTGKMFANLNLKWTFLTFFLVFEIGSAICGASTSSTMFIIGRAVAGLGCAGLVNGALTIITSSLPAPKRPVYTGIAMGIGQIGIITGPLLGGAFTEHATWRWCFYINLPLGGLVAIFLVFTRIPDQTVKPKMTAEVFRKLIPQFDLFGFVLFAPAAIMLLLALQFGSSDYAWNSSQVIGLFCGAVVTGIVFLFWEHRMGDNAMIPFSLVRKRVVWSSSMNYAFLMTVTIVGGNFMPIYFQSVRGLSPTMSGVYMLPAILTMVIFIVGSGAMVTKFGYYLPWALFSAAVTAISCGLISTWSPATSLGMIFGYQILYGVRGSGMQMGVIAIQNFLPPQQIAVGNSFIVFCQNILGAVFVTVANTIFQESLVSGIAKHAPSVNAQAAIAAGGSAEAVRSLAPAGSADLHGVLVAFSESFGNVFYLLTATSCISFLAAFGMGWVDVRGTKEVKRSEA